MDQRPSKSFGATHCDTITNRAIVEYVSEHGLRSQLVLVRTVLWDSYVFVDSHGLGRFPTAQCLCEQDLSIPTVNTTYFDGVAVDPR